MQVSKEFPLKDELSRLGFEHRRTYKSEDNYHLPSTTKPDLFLVIIRISSELVDIDLYENHSGLRRLVFGKIGVNPVHVPYHLRCKLQELEYLKP